MVIRSHPAWVCGLKLNRLRFAIIRSWSHPAWVCGLKQNLYGKRKSLNGVTPCVGVWIETAMTQDQGTKLDVTPCVGVWIETNSLIDQHQYYDVTPCVGVWIET